MPSVPIVWLGFQAYIAQERSWLRVPFKLHARRGTFPLAILRAANLQHTCCRWQMILQPKPGSWGPHHRCKIASNLQQRCCRFELPDFVKGKLAALKAGRCFLLLLPNCQITDADNVKYSRGSAQTGRENALLPRLLGVRPMLGLAVPRYRRRTPPTLGVFVRLAAVDWRACGMETNDLFSTLRTRSATLLRSSATRGP